MKKLFLIFIIFSQGLYPKETNVETYFYSLFPPTNYAIQEKDLRNGYIRFYPKMAEGFADFVIWKLKDKSTLAGVVFYSCGPACNLTELEFYLFPPKSTKSKNVTQQVFDKKKMKTIYNKVLENVTARGKVGDETLWIKLPKKGLDIEFGIMQGQLETDTFIKAGVGKFNGKGFDIYEEW